MRAYQTCQAEHDHCVAYLSCSPVLAEQLRLEACIRKGDNGVSTHLLESLVPLI